MAQGPAQALAIPASRSMGITSGSTINNTAVLTFCPEALYLALELREC